MVKKFYDIPPYTFSRLTEMAVACPRCGKAGTVCFDPAHSIARFQCASCYLKEETVPCGNDTFEVTGQCTSTGRYFRVPRPGNKIHGPKARVPCPFCAEVVIGSVSDKRDQKHLMFEDVRHAQDPYFHYPLYFQASYRGKTIWAFNRAHLQYLIDYLSADIRTVQADFQETYKTMRTQSDMLPAFMKTAKNRAGIVKRLTKLKGKG